jgi:acetyl esterase/lipase
MKRRMLWDGRPPLWPEGLNEAAYPALELDEDAGARGGAIVLVCPGGGYNNLAPHEGHPIAAVFREAGFATGVIAYRVAGGEAREPLGKGPLLDLQRAIRLVRQECGHDRRIVLVGFSAGGHAVASAGVHHQPLEEHPKDALQGISPRPDAMILCYAVISSAAKAHQGSITTLCGPKNTQGLRSFFCLEQQAGAGTPPSFLWHTADDRVVPVENALHFAEALGRLGIPYALHVFSHGVHGLGLAQEHPEAACWPGLAATWLRGVLNRLQQETA